MGRERSKRKERIKREIKELHPDTKGAEYTEEDNKRLLELTRELEEIKSGRFKDIERYIEEIIKRSERNKNKFIQEIVQINEEENICKLCFGTGKEIKSICNRCNGLGTIIYTKTMSNNIKVHSLELCDKCYGLRFIKGEKDCHCCKGKGKYINTE